MKNKFLFLILFGFCFISCTDYITQKFDNSDEIINCSENDKNWIPDLIYLQSNTYTNIIVIHDLDTNIVWGRFTGNYENTNFSHLASVEEINIKNNTKISKKFEKLGLTNKPDIIFVYIFNNNNCYLYKKDNTIFFYCNM